MKNQSSRRASGFTLVELLVVIAIIAVLASAGFAAGNAAIQKARKTTALAAATSIESAVNNFYTEYGSMPKDGDADSTSDTKADITLLKVLLGMDEGGTTPKNSRAVKFLSVREGKSNKGGLIYSTNGANISGMFDPWGGPYQVMLDLDYDEKLLVKPKGAGAQSKTLNGRRVAAWSDGADGVTGTGKVSDDVITW
jgi:prepilin-type N-terminal cleavage/methylation domain-containing protein